MMFMLCSCICLSCRLLIVIFFFSSRRRHTRSLCDWSSDVCSSDLARVLAEPLRHRVDLAAQLSVERERQAQVLVGEREIGRASCREECRSRWARYYSKK